MTRWLGGKRPARLVTFWSGHGWAILVLFLPSLAEAQPVADQNTLLLIQFDRSVNADFSHGVPAAESTARLVDGRFGAGVDMGSDDRIAFVGNDGNFNPAAGTIEFWIKPHWPGNDTKKHSVFTCRFGKQGYININTIGRGGLGVALSSGEGEAWCWRRADAKIDSWKPEQWHYVACAWGNGQLHVYVDGQEGGRRVTDARMPTEAPETLNILGAEAVLDALRLSRRMFTVEDARHSMQLALGPQPYRHLEELTCKPAGAFSAGARKLLGNVHVPFVLGGSRYRRGSTCRPGAKFTFALGGDYETFRAEVGMDAFSPVGDSCAFEVWGDKKKLFDSGPRSAEQAALPIRVSVAGVKELTLATRAEGKVHPTTYCVWANAVLARRGAEVVVSSPRPLKPAELDMYRRQLTADAYTFQPKVKADFFTAGKYWEDDLDPNQPPAPERIGQTLSSFGTPGEYEPLNFVLYAVDDLTNVSVKVSDLRCGEATLPGNQIDVRIVLRGLMRNLYTRPPEQSTVVSRFLLPNQPVDVPAGTMREYHVIVHVPEKATPGKYTGHVRIAPAERPAVELPVEFEVLPFRFRPLTRKAYGIYYRFPADEAEWPRAEIELADIRAHGGTTLKSSLGVQYELAGGRIRPSFDRLVHGVELLGKHGFHGPLPISTGCEHVARLLKYDPVVDHADKQARERFLSTVKLAMEELAELSKKYPQFELLPTHMDEVFGRERLERYIRFTEAVRQVPSLRVFITLHNTPRAGVEEAMRQCDPFVDVRCYNGHAMDEWIKAGHSFEELRRDLERSGDEAWTYYNIRGSFFTAEWTRLVNGFYMWISPLRVHVPWMYYSYQGNPLDDTDGSRLHGHDFAYAVPDPADSNRLIPTRHWEAYREGVDDMRYLCTLEDLIAEHAGSREAKSAQKWLDELHSALTPKPAQLETIEKESPILIVLSEKYDGADYRRFRRQAAQHIERLVSLGK